MVQGVHESSQWLPPPGVVQNVADRHWHEYAIAGAILQQQGDVPDAHTPPGTAAPLQLPEPVHRCTLTSFPSSIGSLARASPTAETAATITHESAIADRNRDMNVVVFITIESILYRSMAQPIL